MFIRKFLTRNQQQPPLPNLVCVGVEKCGTTFLNAAFEGCDDVLTPRKKELFFFNEHFDEGEDWYRSWFDYKSKPEARYVADITPSYFRNVKNLQRMQDMLPGAKIIMVLRHPVYRAFSHYVHRIRHVALKLDGYDCCFEDILAKKDVYSLLCPKYGSHFKRLLDYFPREDILLLSYEGDILNPLKAQAKLAEFLDLDDLDFSAMQGRRINKGAMPSFYYAQDPGERVRIGGQDYELPAGALLLAHAKGTKVWNGIDPDLARENVTASLNWTSCLSGGDVRQIYADHFATDLELLKADFGVDVDHWESMNDPVDYADATPDTELLQAVSA